MLLKRLCLLFILLGIVVFNIEAKTERGFVSLFDGKTLNGWQLTNKKSESYAVTNGVLYCVKGVAGNLLTEKEYSDFVFRFEFRLEPGSNNGVGIRAPLEGDAAYHGLEIQVLDDTTKKYGPLRPDQMHGSVYGLVAAKTGSQKPVGEWNSQEITVSGSKIKVVLNGTTILDTDLSKIIDPEVIKRHPGMLREKGYIGFLGHGDFVAFRNLRIKELQPTRKQ